MTKRKTDKALDDHEKAIFRDRAAETERRINEAIAAAHTRMRKGMTYADVIRVVEEYGMELVLIGRELSARGISRGQSMMLDCGEKCMRILKAWREWEIMMARDLDKEVEFVPVAASDVGEIDALITGAPRGSLPN